MKTRTQIRAFVRAETGEMASDRVDDGQIDQYINYGQLRVQNEFAKINFKSFTKTAYNTGHIFSEPSDLLQYPNAVINLLVSTGAKASASATVGSSGTLIITAREPGTSMNGWAITTTDLGSLSVSLNFTARTGTVGFNATVTTIAEVITYLNADVIFNKYFVASGTSTSQTMANVTIEFALASGTGTGWYPANELSGENAVRVSANAYKAPSSTSPKYRRIGNITPTRTIEVLPNTATYSALEYFYRLADLTADSDTLSVPAEVEELVLIDVQRRIYEKVEKAADAIKMENEYKAKFEQYVSGYFDKRKSETAEKERLQSSDVAN